MLINVEIGIKTVNDGKENNVELSLNREDKLLHVMMCLEMASSQVKSQLYAYAKRQGIEDEDSFSKMHREITVEELTQSHNNSLDDKTKIK